MNILLSNYCNENSYHNIILITDKCFDACAIDVQVPKITFIVMLFPVQLSGWIAMFYSGGKARNCNL